MCATPDPEQGVTAEELYHLMPLQFFYARDGMELPEFRFIDGGEMPDPEKQLLVHDGDMTRRLSEHHGAELGIRVELPPSHELPSSSTTHSPTSR